MTTVAQIQPDLVAAPAAYGPAVAQVQTAVRPIWQCIPFFISAVLFFVSWIGGGVLAINNLGWGIITFWCFAMILYELKVFMYRMSVGSLVLYGGILIWISQNYFAEYSRQLVYDMHSLGSASLLEVASKTSLYVALFFGFAVIGSRIQWGRWLLKWSAKIPEPANPGTLLGVIVGMFLFGLLPYQIFTSENLFVSIYRDIVAMRDYDAGPRWTVGRTGNINYSWGAYVAQWLEIGTFACILAGFYACFYARSVGIKTLCWAMWFLGFMIAFGSGTRGKVVFISLPAAAFLFLRYQYLLQNFYTWLRGTAWRGYATAGVIMLAAFVASQIHGHFRGGGLQSVDISAETFKRVKGNEAFSQNFFVFRNIPEHHDYFFDTIPGQGAVMAIPYTLWQFVITPIPRALWKDKPIDPLWAWINTIKGSARGRDFSTTHSKGLVGSWYGRFGPLGVVEGGLFWGWLLFLFDRMLMLGRHRPLVILLALSGHVWLFRSFRDMQWNSLFPSLIGIFVMSMLLMFTQRKKMTVQIN